MRVVQLLTGFMLGQSTPISYHTEANGCIFFAAGVSTFFLHDTYIETPLRTKNHISEIWRTLEKV